MIDAIIGVVYGVVAVVSCPFIAAVFVNESKWYDKPKSLDYMLGIPLGMFFALIWPIVSVGYIMYRIVRRIVEAR